MMHYTKEMSFATLHLDITSIGHDYQILVYGGERPHIGCCVLSVPRESLNSQTISCTSTIINMIGHKDEHICRLISEYYCKAKNANVCCTGGFHQDNITPDQIAEVIRTIPMLMSEIE